MQQLPQRQSRFHDLPVWRVIMIGTVFVLLFNLAWLIPALSDIKNKVLAHQLEVAEKISIEFQQLAVDHPKSRVEELALFLLSGFSGNVTFDTADPVVAAEFLRQRDDVAEFFIIDGSGRERMRVNRDGAVSPGAFRTLADAAYFRAAARDGFAAAVVRYNEQSMPFVLAVKRYETRELGIFFLAVVVDVGDARAFASRLAALEDEFVYVIDRYGAVITHYDPSGVGAKVSPEPFIMDVFTAQEAGEDNHRFGAYTNERGKKFQATALVIAPLDLAVVVEEPYQTVWSSWYRFLFFIVLSFGFFIALVVFLTRNTLTMSRYSRELLIAKDKVDSIVAQLDAGIIEHDGNFTVLLTNPQAEKLLGFTKGEMAGRMITADIVRKFPHAASLVQVLYPVLGESARKVQAKADGGFDIVEMKISYPAETYLEVTTIPLKDSTGATTSYLRVVRDVSREKAIAKSKSEFISVAAHQLRTPLSAIKWVFKMLLEGDAGPVNSEQKDFLQKGYASNERMIQLVTDMLDVARIEEGRYGFVFYFVDLAEVVQKAVDAFQIRAQERAITLLFHAAPLAPVKIDPARIELVMQNLIDNAMKYTPQGGTVAVNIAKEGRYAHVSVTDNGIGIPREQTDRLFSKFFRGTNAVKQQTEGTGLGLYIAKNIVERHGGTIWAERNKDGPGTTFRFSLPIDASGIPAAEKKTEEFVEGL